MPTYNMEAQRHPDLKNKSSLFSKGKTKKISLWIYWVTFTDLYGASLSTSVHFHLLPQERIFLSLLSSSSNNLFSRSRAERLIWGSPIGREKRKPGGFGHLRSLHETGICVPCPFSHNTAVLSLPVLSNTHQETKYTLIFNGPNTVTVN